MAFKVGEAPWEVGPYKGTAEDATVPVTKVEPAPRAPETFAVGQAPWELGPQAEVKDDDLPIEQQMHPDISFKTRALIKNFSNSDDAAAQYIKQLHPDMEVKSIKGQLAVRNPGEKAFRPIDPSGMDWQDITDLGFDIPAGVAQGVATAAGGVGGFFLGGGVGAIPGAMVAGAGSGAALEAGRQKAGAMMGLPQEVSGRDVAVAGAFGAASPLVFGTGATAGQIAKQVAKRGLSTEAAKDLARSQTSPLVRGVKGLVKGAASVSSGVPKDVISTYIARQKEVDQLAAPGALDNYVNEIQEKINAPATKLKNEIVDKSADYVEQQRKGFLDNQTKQLNDARISVNQELATAQKETAEETAKAEAKHLADVDALEKSRLTFEDPEVLHKQLQDAFYKRKHEVGKRLSENIKGADEMISTEELAAPVVQAINELKLSDIAQTPNGKAAIKELEAQAKGMFNGLPESVTAKTAFELQDQMKLAGNLQNIKGGFQNRYGQGADLISKKWADANMAAYRNTNELLDGVASTKGLKDEYRKFFVLQEKFDRYLGSPEKTAQTIQSLHKPKNTFAKKAAEKAAEITGGKVNLVRENQKLLHNQGVDKSVKGTLTAAQREAKEIEKNYWARTTKAARGLEERLNDSARQVERNNNEAIRLTDKITGAPGLKTDPKLGAIYDNAGVNKQVSELDKYAKTIKTQFGTPEQTTKTLVSSSKKAINPNFKKRVDEINKAAGTDLISDAEKLRAHAYFKDPSLVQLSGGGSTSTTRTLTGAGIGGAIGTLVGGPGVGTAVGSAVGTVATSPAAVKKGIQLYNKIPKVPKGARPIPARLSPWLGMQQRKEK